MIPAPHQPLCPLPRAPCSCTLTPPGAHRLWTLLYRAVCGELRCRPVRSRKGICVDASCFREALCRGEWLCPGIVSSSIAMVIHSILAHLLPRGRPACDGNRTHSFNFRHLIIPTFGPTSATATPRSCASTPWRHLADLHLPFTQIIPAPPHDPDERTGPRGILAWSGREEVDADRAEAQGG